MKFCLFLLLFFSATILSAQEVLQPKNISTLNRIAEEYDTWKWIIGIGSAVIAIGGFLSLQSYFKSKVSGWLDEEIAKKSGLKIEDLKAALSEYAKVAELKKKKILVLSLTEGQQGAMKKALDGFGFANYEWKSIQQGKNMVLENVDLLLFNDPPTQEIPETDIEEIMSIFTTNVPYVYYGSKKIKDSDYRKNYNVQLDFCSSLQRVEAAILSVLK